MRNIFTLFTIMIMSLLCNVSLAQDGANDPTFNPADTNYGNSTDAPVKFVAVQADGKVLICGEFTHFNGISRNHIARLNADGTLDADFSPIGANDNVDLMVLQPDGKIVIGGPFTQYNGISRSGIARLNNDGSLDDTFNPGSGIAPGTEEYNRSIYSVTLQPDGKIIIAGYFGMYNGVQVGRIARLNSDGTLDGTFVSAGTTSGILKTALQPDGKIIVSGTFNNFNGVAVNAICRLNADGTTDTTFNASWIPIVNVINNIVIKADGKILITGNFSYLIGNSFSSRNVIQLSADGSHDITFDVNFFSVYKMQSLAVQSDGKLLVAGAFLLNGEDTYINLIRLNADGSHDTSFAVNRNTYDKGLNTVAECVALLPDNSIMLAGSFMSYGNLCKHFLARISAAGIADETFLSGNGTGADNTIYTSIVQPDGKIVIAGPFNHYNGEEARSLARLDQDGAIDNTFNAGAGANAPIRFSALQPDGKIIIVGDFTTYNNVPVNKIVRINANGSLDSTFSLDSAITINTPYSIKILDSGKILIGAHFQDNTGEFAAIYYSMFKLNEDGSLDNSFVIYQTRAVKEIIALQDGKLLVAYGYYYANFGIQYSVARLNSDGTLDNTFQTIPYTYLREAESMVVQPDGKIIVNGYSSNAQFLSNRLIRLNADGSIDDSFTSSIDAVSSINEMVLQEDGKLIIAGAFSYDGLVNNFARINSDGSLDETFNPGLGIGTSRYFKDINNIHLLPEGKLLITGSFNIYNGSVRNRIARVASSGSLATGKPQIISNTIFVYKSNNTLQVKSLGQVIKEVQVYDLSGKLLSNTKNVNVASTTIRDVQASPKIIIVNITLIDNTKVSKKIYY